MDDPSAFRASGSGVNFPLGILLYLIAQLIGGIWWAATIQAKVDNLLLTNSELVQQNKLQDLQINTLQNGLDERIRGKVKDVFDDWGYNRKGGHE